MKYCENTGCPWSYVLSDFKYLDKRGKEIRKLRKEMGNDAVRILLRQIKICESYIKATAKRITETQRKTIQYSAANSKIHLVF